MLVKSRNPNCPDLNHFELEPIANALAKIHQFDLAKDYIRREKWIWVLAFYCGKFEVPLGIRFDPVEGPEWPVIFFELPTGQVSWHMAQHPIPWDNHTTEEKYRRIEEFVEL